MYRDDAAALGERGAALEEQLAQLRAAGPPGVVARIAEIEDEQRATRRFRWAYLWLAGLWGALLPPLAGMSLSRTFAFASMAGAVMHLWLELGRQRTLLARRRHALTERIAAGQGGAPTPATRTDIPEPTELADVVVRQEALARELALYRTTGTQDQALDVELTREQQDLARHGRPFLWLAAAFLVLVLPVKGEQEAFDLMPVLLGSLGLVLRSFAVRLVTHARDLRERLAVARRERQRAERGARPSLGAPTSEEALDGLRAQTDAARLARHEVERRREARDRHFTSLSRAGTVCFASTVVLAVCLLGAFKDGVEATPLVVACLSALGVVLSLGYTARSAAAVVRNGRALRLAELEDEAAEEHLHRLREEATSTTAENVSPRVRVDVENLLEEELPASARYHRYRELP